MKMTYGVYLGHSFYTLYKGRYLSMQTSYFFYYYYKGLLNLCNVGYGSRL